MNLSQETRQLINSAYQGRTHMKMTMGTLVNGQIEVISLGENKEPSADVNRPYAVGSIAKPFTASLLAKYVDEGKLDLNAPLSDYIPHLPVQYYPSLRRLATHSSGYGAQPYTMRTALPLLLQMNRPNGMFRLNPYHGVMNEKIMIQTLSETQLQDHTYDYQYSNFGIGVLGYILGAISGEGYWDSMNRFIRQELCLQDTFLGSTDEVIGHDKKNQPCISWVWDKEDVIAAAGALVSTAEDLLRFAQLNLDGSKPYMAMCHEKQEKGTKRFSLGLAWRLKNGTDISWHTGAAGAYSAFLGIDRVKKTAVVTACNYGLVKIEKIGFSLLDHLC